MKEDKKQGHLKGGKRRPVGCPKGSIRVDPNFRRIRVSFRLPQYLVDWLSKQQAPKGHVIEDALDHYITTTLDL